MISRFWHKVLDVLMPWRARKPQVYSRFYDGLGPDDCMPG